MRTEAIVGYIFFLIILAAGPVILMVSGGYFGKTTNAVRAIKVINSTVDNGDMFTYLADNPTQFVLFCALGAAILTALYVLYQSLITELLSLSFDNEAQTVAIELVKPYQDKSTIITLPISEFKFGVGKKEIKELKGIAKHMPVLSVYINDRTFKIETGEGPWEETDRETIVELEELLLLKEKKNGPMP